LDEDQSAGPNRLSCSEPIASAPPGDSVKTSPSATSSIKNISIIFILMIPLLQYRYGYIAIVCCTLCKGMSKKAEKEDRRKQGKGDRRHK